MEKKKLNLLIVEDNPDDAELAVNKLKQEGFIVEWRRVETKEDFRKSLDEKLNLILADYVVPSFGGIDALKIKQKNAPEIPLIIISGKVSEDIIVECMKLGAVDYVLKDKLYRLGPVVRRALEEVKVYQEHKRAVEKIERLYSLQTAIRDINQLIIRTKREPELLKQICDTIVKLDYIKFAWIGFTQKGSFDVKPVAQAGFEEGYLSSIKVTWDDSKYGRGPTGMAIKTGKPFIMRDIENDLRFKPWKKDALKRGYKSSIAVPLIIKKETIGAVNVYSKIKDSFGDEEIRFLVEVADDIAVGIKSIRLEKELKQSYKELQKTIDNTVLIIVKIIEVRDPYTAGHQQRVSRLSNAIAKEIGLSKDKIKGILVSSLMHDIGKISLPSELLSKPGRLTETEFNLIKDHPKVGYDILKTIDLPWPVAEIVLNHHEKMDGSGYPNGLKGNKILIESRIICVADVVEAMTSHRPYRPAFGIDKALKEISKNKGTLYDSRIVDACIKLFKSGEFKF